MPAQYIDIDTLQTIRRRLWAVSKEKKITLEDIQDRTEFSYSQVYRIMRGDKNISVSGFIAVCCALETQPSEIFNFEVNIPSYPPLRKDRKKK